MSQVYNFNAPSQKSDHKNNSKFTNNPLFQLNIQSRIKTQDDQKVFSQQQTTILKTEKSTSVPRDKSEYTKLSSRKKKNQTFHMHDIQTPETNHLPTIKPHNIKQQQITFNHYQPNFSNPFNEQNDDRISVENFYYRFYTPQKFLQDGSPKFIKTKTPYIESEEKFSEHSKPSQHKPNNSLVLKSTLFNSPINVSAFKIKKSKIITEIDENRFVKNENLEIVDKSKNDFELVYQKLRQINAEKNQMVNTRAVTPKRIVPDENTFSFRQITELKTQFYEQYQIQKPSLITYQKFKNFEIQLDPELKFYLNHENILKREQAIVALTKPQQLVQKFQLKNF